MMNRNRSACPPFAPAVVVPTYNNGRTLLDVLRRVEKLGLPIIVVNDGSTDETGRILAEWRGGESASGASRGVGTHSCNRGKAAALMTGFEAAFGEGFTHAATIDSDGQLAPEEIPALLAVAQGSPDALVLGARDARSADYPARSRWGRAISNALVWMESGQRVSDSQCGLRVYPLALVTNVRCRSDRYGYETEIIAQAGRMGWEIREVPVSCVYFTPGDRVSHFRPWMDSVRSGRMHAWLLLAPGPWFRRALAALRQEPAHLPRGSGRLAVWTRITEAWRAVRQDGRSHRRLALAVACGVFIGNQPAYGFQTLLSLCAGRLLGLNPVAVVLGSFISTPPLNIFLLAAAVATGHLLLHGSMPLPADLDAIERGLGAVAGHTAIDWVVGAPVIGAILAGCAFLAVIRLTRRGRYGSSIDCPPVAAGAAPEDVKSSKGVETA